MRLLVKLKTGEEAIIVGYAPGRKGRPVAIALVGTKLRAVKLRQIELVGFAKIRSNGTMTVFDEAATIPDDVWNKFAEGGKPH